MSANIPKPIAIPSMTFNLEPCPLCGKTPLIWTEEVVFCNDVKTKHLITCKNCGDKLSTMKSLETLETEWNRAVRGYRHFKKLENKPPLGIVPKRIHDDERKLAIFEAMERYVSNEFIIPIEWIKELKELCLQ